MMKWKFILFALGASLLMAACAAPPCSRQNKDKFVTDVKEVGYAFDAMEFNVAYNVDTKAVRLKELRGQAQQVSAPECAEYLKVLMLQSLDERLKDIGNPANKIRPASGVFQNELKAFENASIAQITDVANSQTNNTGFLQIIIILAGMLVVLLLGFGGYFAFQARSPSKIITFAQHTSMV